MNLFHTSARFFDSFRPKTLVSIYERHVVGDVSLQQSALAVVSFSLKHTFRRRSVDCPGGSLDFFSSSLPIHYHFVQTVISTGNLHPAAICVCGECIKKKERD